MDTSRRAVESYWRSRMIDTATSDEDKVTPVYKLEEICELLRSSHVSIVKEISGFVLKRLDHKSPIVKQKALRLIKYAVGKSGVEFRREMQRHSVSVRQLFHYKGQPDPLKGDALNKSVRDTAQEAIAAIFSEEDSKPAPAEDLNRRIQGFGNANYEIPTEDKKSFLSGVVGLGSASIKHGLSNFTQGNSFKKTEATSYRGPNLQRSLTTEIDNTDRYEPVEYNNEKKSSYGISKNLDGGSWVQDSMTTKMENSNGESSSSNLGSKNSEERLLETIVTTGGVRLQPTRDAIQVFLGEAAKLNAVALSLAIASKLQSPLWQVRLKAVCVLESILRKKDYVHFSVVESYFTENADVILQCSESPQSSLRDRAQKVLTLLGGDQVGRTSGLAVKPDKAATTAAQLPDLIDTGDFDGHLEDSTKVQNNQTTANLTLSSMPLIDDLFGDSNINGNSTNESKTDDDPFADVSFHTGESGEHHDDLFKGMSLDDSVSRASDAQKVVNNQRPEVFDIFGLSSEFPVDQGNHNNGIHDLMANLSVNENQPKPAQQGTSFGTLHQTVISGSNTNQTHQVSSDINNILGSESVASNGNTAFPMGPMLYSMPPGFSLGQAIPPQMANFGVMGNLFAQQQFLATMANFQHLGNFSSQHAGGGHPTGAKEGGNFSPLPDIFNPNIPSQTSSGMLSTPKKEETKAFDFISDHVAAARDSKRAA